MLKWLKYSLLFIALLPLELKADEGMWIPSNIPDSIFKSMQLAGLQLSKKDLYNPDSSNFMDAFPMFGKGCSSGIISPDGLLITNYHCARYLIQSHSTITNNLLESGFTANSFSEELTNNNLTIEFTRRIIDISKDVLKGTNEKSTIKDRDSITSRNISIIEKHYKDSTNLNARIETIFFGLKYILILSEEYKDIRLVYSPPESIANFGGDKDNWSWPRHCADFAIFRIYSDSNNKPNIISKNNIPFQAKKYLPISTKEKKENDFTMAIGYPGSTEEFLPPSAIEAYRDSILPIRLFARKQRLDIMKQYMDSSKFTNLNYTSKYISTSNYYLKWQSDKKQLSTTNKSFSHKTISNIDPEIENELNKSYIQLAKFQQNSATYYEGLLSLELILFTNKIGSLIKKKKSETDIIPIIRNYYQTHTIEIDRDYFFQLITYLFKDQTKNKSFIELLSLNKKATEKSIIECYNKSFLSDSNRLLSLIQKHPKTWNNTIQNDYLYVISEHIFQNYFSIESNITKQKKIIDSLQRINITKLINKKRIIYPDANSTLRISFGKIKSYQLTDGIQYDYKTTMLGIKEKFETGDMNYSVDNRLLEMLSPSLSTCYISTCHTTGGNSGSPIINGKGEFIGLNYDRNIEGTTNDYIYREYSARNIWLNSNYIIYLLKDYSKANHIIQSLKIF